MPRFGYVVFQLRAHAWGSPDRHLKLSDLDGRGADTLDLITKAVETLHGEIVKDEKTEYAHRIDESDTHDRAIFITGTSGPYGLLGNAVHLDTGQESPIDERTATMTSLRSMIFVPDGLYDGFIFCERVGNRLFKGALERHILRHIAKEKNIVYKIFAHVDWKAWGKFLDAASVSQITTIYRAKRIEDLEPIRSRSSDLKITAGGIVAHKLGRQLTNVLSKIADRDAPVAVNIDEYPDLKPGNPDQYDRESLEVRVESGGSERLIVVEREQLPQFVYLLGKERATDAALRRPWLAQAGELLSEQGSTLAT